MMVSLYAFSFWAAIACVLLSANLSTAQVTFPGKSDRMFLASDKLFFSACEGETPPLPLATRNDVLEALAAVGMSQDSLQSLDSAGFHWIRGEDTGALEFFEEITAGVPYRETDVTRSNGWRIDGGESFLAWQWEQWDSSAMRFWSSQTLPVCSLHAVDVDLPPEPASSVPEPQFPFLVIFLAFSIRWVNATE